MINTAKKGDAREREFLWLCEISQRTEELPSVQPPDRHLDADEGQLKICGLRFDFAWIEAGVVLELDGGQWMAGGGRHGGDEDRWKTMLAVAEGWRVVHVSPAMVKREPARLLQLLRNALDTREAVPF